MSAILFSLMVFFFWWLIGTAVLSIFKPRLSTIQTHLIAPAVGISMTLLLVFLLNREGVPVINFGRTLLILLSISSILILLINRLSLSIQRVLPYLLILVIALILGGWPMFLYQFDWMSVANDDMANYCLAAERFLYHGYFDLPNLVDYFSGRHYSLVYWFMHVSQGMRSGSELMLAFWWAATGLNAHQLFMPVIFALNLSLICATGALLAERCSPKQGPLIAMSLLSISPLNTLGAIYQLIGQVGGLTLLCTATVLLFRQIGHKACLRRFTANVPGAIVLSAVLVWYPEVLPFLGMGWLLFFSIKTYKKPRSFKSTLLPIFVIFLFTALLVGPFILTALHVMFAQGHLKPIKSALDVVLFPYFLIPSGIPKLFGLLPLTKQVAEPYLSIIIGFGIFLLLWVLWQTLKKLATPRPPAIVLSVMLLLSLVLFYEHYDFGLFKIAMYMQPFLVAVAAMSIATWRFSDNKMALLLLSVVLGFALVSQYEGVKSSTDKKIGGIPFGSSKKLNRQFDQLIHQHTMNEPCYFVSDTANVVLGKYQSLYTLGLPVYFPSRNFFELLDKGSSNGRESKDYLVGVIDNTAKKSFLKELRTRLSTQYKQAVFPMDKISNTFAVLQVPKQCRQWIITHHQTIFNQSHESTGFKDSSIEFVAEPKNHLVFIDSDLGRHYYGRGKKNAAYTPLENDPMFQDRYFSALGQYLLFNVIGSSHPRMILELSSTLLRQFDSKLPEPVVYGSTKTTLAFVGRGSGRVISEPFAPLQIDGQDYITVDIGRPGREFIEPRRGLMSLYGKGIHNDWRFTTTFGRNISLITEEEYQAMIPPSHLQKFPTDLANPNLQYSGIYEDGQLSEQVFVVLQPTKDAKYLLIRGTIPQIANTNRYVNAMKRIMYPQKNVDALDFKTQLSISINGKRVRNRELRVGAYELKIPVILQQKPQRIELTYNNQLRLPNPDGRLIVGKIDFIGFVEK